jgi:hypothetical protein
MSWPISSIGLAGEELSIELSDRGSRVYRHFIPAGPWVSEQTVLAPVLSGVQVDGQQCLVSPQSFLLNRLKDHVFYKYLFQTYRIGQAERSRGANGWIRNSVIGWMLAATRAVEARDRWDDWRANGLPLGMHLMYGDTKRRTK